MAPPAVTGPSRPSAPRPDPRPQGFHRLAVSPVGHYGCAVLGVLVALLLHLALWPFMSTSPFLFFYAAVLFAGWWGGGGPGLLATVLSTIAVTFFFLPPVHSLVVSPGEFISLALFGLLSVLATRLNVVLRRTSAERASLLERERAVRSEAEAERSRLHDLLMQAPACVTLLRSPQHVCVLSNPVNDALLGHRTLLGRPIRETVPEWERQGLLATLDRVYATGEPFTARELPIQVSGPEGTEREVFLDFVFQPTRDARGAIDGVAFIGFDITTSAQARQQAEALATELKRSEERYRTFVSQSSEGIFRVETLAPVSTTDSEEAQVDAMLRMGYIAECNDAMAHMYGLDGAQTLVGARLEQLLVREDPRNIEYMRTFIRNGYRVENSVSHEVDQEGQPKVFVNNLIGVVKEGFLVTAWGIQRDITEQRRAEEARARAEANARFLAEASAVLSASLDYEATLRNVARLAVPALADWCFVDLLQPDGHFQRVEGATAMAEDAEFARQAQPLGPAPEGRTAFLPTHALLRGESLLIEQLSAQHLQAIAPSEEFVRRVEPRSFIAVPLVTRGRVLGVLSFLTCRSGRRYTPEDLAFLEELAYRVALSVENARLYREAQDAIRLRDEFLSIASHELKTPLTPLSLKLQMLAREVRKQPESPLRRSVEDYVATGARQVKKLSELVSDLLDVTRISGGRLRLELEDVDLTTLVREVVARYEPEAARLGSTLVLDVQAMVVGYWDRLRLEQVITNLVDNAIKYGAGKPVRLRLHLEHGKARVSVSDEGIGIAPEYLPRLFGRFERAVSERHYGGLGLGLYITRTIVEAMGGHIEVDSRLGLGSTFTVELPLRPAEAMVSASSSA